MADLDRDLSTRLSRLADAVPMGRGQLDPVHASAVAARQRVRFAWMTPLVGLLIVVGASVLWPGPRPSPGATPSPGPSASSGLHPGSDPPTSTAQDGDFELVLRAGKFHYAPDEPINASATLTYRGAAQNVEISTDSMGTIRFGIRERVFGEISVGGISDLTCDHVTLSRDTPVVEAFKKSGSFLNGDDPRAGEFMKFLEDPLLRLPEGTWHLYATASSPCMGSEVAFELSTEIEIVVDDDPTATPGHPAATESPNKPVYGGADIGPVALQLKSERSTYEVGGAIGLSVWYWFMDGPEVVASHFQPEVGLSIEQLDATDPRSRVVLTDSACTDLGVVTGMERHVDISPRLITLLRADTVPTSFDDLFVNGDLHLPIGRWRISASVTGEFGRCSGGGEPYAIGTSLEIQVIEHLN